MNYNFFGAVKDNNIQKVRDMLVSGTVDINAVDPYGNTVLHYACYKKYKNMVIMLIKMGANLDIRNNEDDTCLFITNLDIVDILVRAGSNVNIQDNFGNSALHHIVNKIKKLDLYYFKLFIEYGFDVNLQNSEGNTVLHRIISYGHNYNDLSYYKLFVENGFDVNIQNNHGKTLLMNCLINKNINVFEYLLKHGANIFIKDIDGCDVLYFSIRYDQYDIFKELMKSYEGYNLNSIHYAIDNNDMTLPMVIGSYNLKRFLIYILNNYKFNINYVSRTFNTLYNFSHSSIKDYLVERYKNINVLSSKKLKENFEKQLISKRVNNKGLDLFFEKFANDYVFGSVKIQKKSKKSKNKKKSKKSKNKKKSKKSKKSKKNNHSKT